MTTDRKFKDKHTEKVQHQRPYKLKYLYTRREKERNS